MKKLKRVAEKVTSTSKNSQQAGKTVNASFDYILENFDVIFESELNEAAPGFLLLLVLLFLLQDHYH